jgi:hypothetical protein
VPSRRAFNANREIVQFLSFVYILVGWHASAVSFPLGGSIFSRLTYPLNDVINCLHREEQTYLSINIVRIIVSQVDVVDNTFYKQLLAYLALGLADS